MHARQFVQEQHVPMNSRKWEVLPSHPKQAFQAGLETCQSVINLLVIRASQRLASLGQVDLVSKLGSVVTPCWRVGIERKDLLSQSPKKPFPQLGRAPDCPTS
jgi:hypothetical protein